MNALAAPVGSLVLELHRLCARWRDELDASDRIMSRTAQNDFLREAGKWEATITGFVWGALAAAPTMENVVWIRDILIAYHFDYDFCLERRAAVHTRLYEGLAI